MEKSQILEDFLRAVVVIPMGDGGLWWEAQSKSDAHWETGLWLHGDTSGDSWKYLGKEHLPEGKEKMPQEFQVLNNDVTPVVPVI